MQYACRLSAGGKNNLSVITSLLGGYLRTKQGYCSSPWPDSFLCLCYLRGIHTLFCVFLYSDSRSLQVFSQLTHFNSSKSYPSSWAAGKHPVCSVPLGHCTALSEPEPGQKHIQVLLTHNFNNFNLDKNKTSRVRDCKGDRNWFTWVVAVMESTKVGTVEQLRFSRRPWRGKKKQQHPQVFNLTQI